MFKKEKNKPVPTIQPCC